MDENHHKEITHSLLQLVRILEQESRLSRKTYKVFGVTESQGLVIRQLAKFGPCSLIELSKSLHVSPSNITGLVDRLEAKGLVRRARQYDRRIIHIHLTPKGEELTEILPDPLEVKIGTALKGLPLAELQAFYFPIASLLKSFGSSPPQEKVTEQLLTKDQARRKMSESS